MFLFRTRPSLWVALLLGGAPVWVLAASAPPAPPGRAVMDPQPLEQEPAVQRTVTTRADGTVVIEETRVRGETQNITVHPKKGSGLPDYEIVPSTRGRDPHTNGSGSRGAAGQRVWSILKF